MPNQAYRLRIRSADDLSNTLVITSIRGGTNPYISGVPSGDGQEVDLLTGAVRTGAYNVEVVDAVIGTDSTGTLRIVTQNLYDGVEEYLLLENGDKILLENGDPIDMYRELRTNDRYPEGKSPWSCRGRRTSPPRRTRRGLPLSERC